MEFIRAVKGFIILAPGCTGFPGENTPPYLPNFVIEKKVLKDWNLIEFRKLSGPEEDLGQAKLKVLVVEAEGLEQSLAEKSGSML